MTKKIICLLFVLLMMLSIFAAVPSAANADADLAVTGDDSGVTGDCTWKVENKVLTISGNGKMGDYSTDNKDEYAPWRYSRITEAVIEEGVTTIGACAFSGCDELQKVRISKTVTDIYNHAFSMCRYLTTVNIPDTVLNIEEYAFFGCRKLTGVHIPCTITWIKRSTFYGCSSIKKITLPDNVAKIDSFAFYNCAALESIILPESVQYIGDHAFANCTDLMGITVPAGVIEIEEWAIGFKSYSVIEGFAIFGTPGTVAEQYANKNKIPFIEGTAPSPKYYLGDADEDETVTILDVTAIQRDLAFFEVVPFNASAADADRDTKVTILDATEIQRYLAGLPAHAGIGELTGDAKG